MSKQECDRKRQASAQEKTVQDILTRSDEKVRRFFERFEERQRTRRQTAVKASGKAAKS